MTAPATVPVLNGDWAAVLTGRDISRFTSSSTQYSSSSTEYHNKIYSNGRIDSSYEYQFSGTYGSSATHTDYYGQWWVETSGQSNGVYWADVRVYWYQSTDPAAIGTSQVIRISTSNGSDFTIGGDAYGSSLINDASGSGNDVLDSSATATMGPTLLGKDGDDTLIGNDAHADHLFGGSGADSLEGRGADDRLYGQLGDDTLDGGAGTDLALYSSAANQFTVTQAGAPDRYAVAGPEGTDQLIGVEYIQFADAAPVAIESLVSPVIAGTAGDDALTGTAGVDSLDGLAGNDSLAGLAGNDTLQGGAGKDTLDGGSGVDTMVGGADDDLYLVDNAGDVVTEAADAGTDLVQASATCTLSVNVESLTLTGAAAINGTGNALANVITGNGADNVLDGGAGVDTVSYASAAAGVSVSLAQGAQQITGGAGSDTLLNFENLGGSNFNDTLTGDAGANALEGRAGNDTLSGGAGADVFGYDASGNGIDTITDFAIGDSLRIGIALPILAVTAGDGSTVTGQRVEVDTAGGVSTLYVDTDNVAGVDVQIGLPGVIAPGQIRLARAANGDTLVSLNSPATGTVSIGGTAEQGQTLTAGDNLADADGMGPLQYQWLADGQPIADATGASVTLAQNQVGRSITVRVSYQDGFGAIESVLSTATGPVVNINDPPEGAVTIAGAAVQGQTLSASNTLADIDGMGTVSYQWKADDSDIAAATAASLTLGEAEVGKAIRVVARYTDGQGTVESVASAATAVVVMPGQLNLDGRVYQWKNHTLLGDVSVTAAGNATGMATSDTTGIDGQFQLDALASDTYSLGLARANTDAGNAITSADALAALRIAVGVNPNTDGNKLSPFQLIAADANGDSRVTSADALAILRMAVKQAGAPTPQWLFVSEEKDLWDETSQSSLLTRLNTAWTSGLTTQLQQATSANVVAVLCGDVNGSWSAPAGSMDLDLTQPAYFEELAARLGVPTDVWGI